MRLDAMEKELRDEGSCRRGDVMVHYQVVMDRVDDYRELVFVYRYLWYV